MIRAMEFAIPPMVKRKSRVNIPLIKGIPKCKT